MQILPTRDKINIKVTCYIQQVYDQYKRSMSGMQIETPLPETVHLCDENFLYWIKLQWHNPTTNSWHDASQARCYLYLLLVRSNEKGYRLKDPRRARVLPHLPNLLRHPDRIYANCHGSIRGKHVYVQEHRGQFEVA